MNTRILPAPLRLPADVVGNLRLTIESLKADLAESDRLGTEAHRALLDERDRSQALALELEAAQDNLRDASAMLAAALGESLRQQTLASDLSRQLAMRDLDRVHGTGKRLRATAHRVSYARNSYSRAMEFDVSDAVVVDVPDALDNFGGG